MPRKKSIALFFLFLAFDLASKTLAGKFFPEAMIENPGILNPAATLALLAVFIFLYFRFFGKSSWGFVLIVSGAAANLADRMYFGYARDFIDIGMATFNIADLFIWGGIILLLISNIKAQMSK